MATTDGTDLELFLPCSKLSNDALVTAITMGGWLTKSIITAMCHLQREDNPEARVSALNALEFIGAAIAEQINVKACALNARVVAK